MKKKLMIEDFYVDQHRFFGEIAIDIQERGVRALYALTANYDLLNRVPTPEFQVFFAVFIDDEAKAFFEPNKLADAIRFYNSWGEEKQ
jgi:hypothetical protein